MLHPRRFLPSLSLLSAFEAVARTGSVTAAAHELALTQSAVSRQIKALEEQLEVALFTRERQSVRLTAGGAAYAHEIRDALGRISAASLNLRANPAGGTLTLAILPTFGTRWLAPRLPRFFSAHPGVTMNLLTRMTVFDFAKEAVDAAIHFGAADWPGADAVRLRGEVVVPTCAPALRERLCFVTAADIAAAPLLHLTSRPDAWERWLAHHRLPPRRLHGMLFDQFGTLAQAAISGLGVALLPDFVARDEIRAGTLVPALDLPMPSSDAYHLVWPRERADHPPLVAFRDWLIAEAASGEA
jgi:LysR family glycine cleavage system transcriptional activator